MYSNPFLAMCNWIYGIYRIAEFVCFHNPQPPHPHSIKKFDWPVDQDIQITSV